MAYHFFEGLPLLGAKGDALLAWHLLATGFIAVVLADVNVDSPLVA
jgi:hypothetical protein